MCCEIKCLMNSLIDTISGTDWWMFGITSVSIICSAILSILLYRLTKKLGEQQNSIQQNNLRIQMHKEYFEIYEALDKDLTQIENLKFQFLSLLEEGAAHPVCNNSVERIMPRAKQLLPPNDYDKLDEFLGNYKYVEQNTLHIYKYTQSCYDEFQRELKNSLKKEGIESFLNKLYDITDYFDVEDFRNRIIKIINLRRGGFVEKIRLYSDLSDILQNK